MRRYWHLLVWVMILAVAGSAPAWAAGKAKPAKQRCKLVFSDGAALTKLKETHDLKVVYLSKKIRGKYFESFVYSDPQRPPGSKDKKAPARPGFGLNPDGSFTVAPIFVGKYALRLLGRDVAEFKVKKDELGLVVSGLPSTVRLPFSHIMRVNAPRRRVEVINPKTKKKRMKSVPMDLDWAQVEVRLYDGGKTDKLKVVKFNKFMGALLTGSGKKRCVMVLGPGSRPFITSVQTPGAKYQGDLGRRIIQCTLRPFKLVEDKKGIKRVHGVPSYVYQTVRKSYYWLAGFRFKGQGQGLLWLMHYNRKKQRGGGSPITFGGIAEGGTPLLYLDEKGGLRMLKRKGDSSPKQQICYSLNTNGKASPAKECIYPHFKYRGRVIKGNRWIMPNLGGIPLGMGSGSITVNGVAKHGKKTMGVSASYEIRVDGPIPHVTEGPKSTACTGARHWDAHSDDNRLCLDPPADALFMDKGPPPKMPKNCEKSDGCMKQFRDAMKAWASYRPPPPPNYAPLISGEALFGGITYPYVQKVKYRNAVGYDDEKRMQFSGEHEEILSGLPPLQNDIQLVTSHLGYRSIIGPINLQKGPYPELRYRAQPVDPKTHRKIRKGFEVIKVYPQNYRVEIDGDEVKIDRSSLLKPPGPDQDGDHDGIPNSDDLCPDTPAQYTGG